MGLTLRTEKGSALTYGELDENFVYLSNEINTVSSYIVRLTRPVPGVVVCDTFDWATFYNDATRGGSSGVLYSYYSKFACTSSFPWIAADINGFVNTNIAGTNIKASYFKNDIISRGTGSVAFGRYTTASGEYNLAYGRYTSATGRSTHAEGEYTFALNTGSHAEGTGSIASGSFSHVEGEFTTARGYASHTEGTSTRTFSPASHAEGKDTVAGYLTYRISGSYQATPGYIVLDPSYGNVTSAFSGVTYIIINSLQPNNTGWTCSTIDIDVATYNALNNTTVIDLLTNNYYISASTFSVGIYDNPNPLRADIPIGWYSHAEGEAAHTIANGSHAEGISTRALGPWSHTEGTETKAYGNSSHTEGLSTKTYPNANESHAEGKNTEVGAAFFRATVSGSTNPVTGVTTLTMAGNFSLAYVAGISVLTYNYTTNGGNPTEIFVDTIVQNAFWDQFGTIGPPNTTYIYLLGSVAYNTGDIVYINRTDGLDDPDAPVFFGGNYSHAEGYYTKVRNIGAHAEGRFSEALGEASHAEGNVTKAYGRYSHAEGRNTLARGESSHAEGKQTLTLGSYSHAGGWGTQAFAAYQTVFGQWNIPNNGDDYFVIGDGQYTPSLIQSNALGVNATRSYFSNSIYLPDLPLSSSQYVVVFDTASKQIYYTASSAIGGGGGGAVTQILAGNNTTVTSTGPNGTGIVTIDAATVSPAAPDMGVQFNVGGTPGVFGASPNFTYNYFNQALSHGGGNAVGGASFAHGYITTANNNYSHAEGHGTVANGGMSHAEGYYTIAHADYQHATGRLNLDLNTDDYFVIGDGDMIQGTRSNAFGVNSTRTYLSNSIFLPDLTSDPQTSVLTYNSVTKQVYFTASAAIGGGGTGPGVTRIIAGTNITISPASGVGTVTINATGGGGGGNSWLLSGNTATANDFLGTINNIPLTFRVNNLLAGSIGDGLSNTFLGLRAGISNTTGNANTAFGFNALNFNTNGAGNTAGGCYALSDNTTGASNTAFGSNALTLNTIGNYNTSIGMNSLANNTGDGNTANGFQALYNNTTGTYNTATGYQALNANNIGFWNTANGDQALFSNTSGTLNTAIGFQALYSNITGDRNIAIGPNAGRNGQYANTLIVDVFNRVNQTNELNQALIVGTFDPAVANQRLQVNGILVLPYVSQSLNFANDAAAQVGGVPLGGVYHTAGTLKIRLV